ncbi:MAG: hypothetical protein K6F34_02380 [Lachnospiraceae bacterium]|nr:hypothetical protein [Lachnospiraceae bacterium]
MRVDPVNEMTVPAYREIKPVDNRELERSVEKVGSGAQAPAIKEPYKPEPAQNKPEVDEGRETIGVSNDGDIAKASREGLENVNEGMVLKKVVTEASQKAPSEDAKKAEEGSLIAYSKSELERLYLQGDISSNQLDKELERREEIRGEKKEAAQAVREDEKTEKENNEEIAAAMESDRESGVKEAALRQSEVTALNKEAGDKQAQRIQEDRQVEAVREETNAGTEASDETRKQIITEEMVNDEEFIENMNVLAGARREDEIVSDALDTAVENNRLKLMEQVLNVDPALASNV